MRITELETQEGIVGYGEPEEKLGHGWRSPMLFHEDGSVGDW